MKRYGPKGLAKSVGFQWPTVAGAYGPCASRPRASSPHLEQGGRVEILIRRSCSAPSGHGAVAPQSGFDCRRLAPPYGSANPTTPAPAAGRASLPLAPPSVPSVASAPTADAMGSPVPGAPARTFAGRGWSAYADDDRRSAFPLGPPSFAPEGVPAKRAFISLAESAVPLRAVRLSGALSSARRPA